MLRLWKIMGDTVEYCTRAKRCVLFLSHGDICISCLFD